MATLKEFKEFLVGRAAVLERAEKRLCQIQQKYEEFFAEITRCREAEYTQLRDHIAADAGGGAIPADFKRQLEEARKRAEARFDEQRKAVEKSHATAKTVAEQKRQRSLAAEQSLHAKNLDLDAEEEQLKARNERLLADMATYNQRIREMSRGFGFFWNLFAMRRQRGERERLASEQADVLARIDELRRRWVDLDAEHAKTETSLQEDWLILRTEAAAQETKLEHLDATRERIVERTALEEVLFSRKPNLALAQARDARCKRCNQPNPATSHFCHICGLRLAADRPDFAGSLLEIAELNRHHEVFSEGMKACQEMIGLVRGLKTGVANFTKSVDDMLATERRYPVGTLKIDVPKASIAYGESFEALAEAADPKRSLHPKDFGAFLQQKVKDVYTEPNVKAFFETMGQELSKQADAQW